MNNCLIAIDPGTTSAIVVITIEMNPKLVHHEIWKSGKSYTPSVIIENVRMHGSIFHAAIEDQYLGKNANSMKILTRIGGRWQEACEREGLSVTWVPPRAWQTKVFGARWGSQRKQIDQMMKLVARQDTGVKLTADESAAWCIGKYAIWEMAK